MQYNFINRLKFAHKLINEGIENGSMSSATDYQRFERFIAEKIVNDNRYKGLNSFSAKYAFIKLRLADWLQGLTSVINVPFEYHEIIVLANEYGLNRNTELKQNHLLNIYYDLLAYALTEKWGKYISCYINGVKW